jgi:excinuclease ABC subunit B
MVGDSEASQKIKDEANSYTPSGRKKGARDKTRALEMAEEAEPYMGGNMQVVMASLETRMFKAAENLEFEEAARLRDEMSRLKAEAEAADT